MSTTRTLHRRRPAAHAQTTAPAHAQTTAHTPAHAPTSAPAPISPADVEGALLDNYPDLVRLAYANLPAKLPRHHRVLAAHTVVQRALQGRDLLGVTDAKEFVRDRVQEDAIEQAQARTPLRSKPRAWVLHLQALIEPSAPAGPSDRTGPTGPTESSGPTGLTEARGASHPTEPTSAAFDPCSLKPACRAELLRRNTRAANLVIVVTTLLALGILASLLINR